METRKRLNLQEALQVMGHPSNESYNLRKAKIPFNAIKLIELLKHAGHSAYLVGGCIRDLLIFRNPHDWDICTSAKPDEIISLLESNKINHHTVGIQYGTVTALMQAGETGEAGRVEEYEITTYRADGAYDDSRHPSTVRFMDSIDADLGRRDFTINALAYDPVTDVLIDNFGGINDLNNYTIRAIGNAAERFSEDGLRILRALRFSIVFDFDIEDKTAEAMHNSIECLDGLSHERITEELRKMLTCGKCIRTQFTEYDWIITRIIPELKSCVGFKQNNKYHKHEVYEHMLYVVDGCNTRKFEIKLAALLHDIGKPEAYVVDDNGEGHFYGHPDICYRITEDVLTERLVLTRDEFNLVTGLVLNHDMTVANTEKSVKRAMNKYGVDFLYDWIVLKESDINDHINLAGKHVLDKDYIINTMQEIINKNQCFNLRMLAVNGKDVMEVLQLKPCKVIGDVLNYLLEKVIDGEIENTKESLMQSIKKVYGVIRDGKDTYS